MELQLSQKEIKQEIRRAKLRYKQKVEDKLTNNNLGSAWESLKIMTGQSVNVNKKVSSEGFSSDQVLANELNKFYCRFDVCDFRNDTTLLKKSDLCEPVSA